MALLPSRRYNALQVSENRSILIVDDDRDFLDLLGEILSQGGYSVIATQNPSEVLLKIESAPQKPAAIIIDQKMDGLTGVELLKKIRASHPSLPVVVVSGFLDNSTAQEMINLGVSGIFFKPLNIFALLKRLEDISKGLAKSSGIVPALVGSIKGFTRMPFGNSKDLFFKRLESLGSFKGNLLLVGDAQSPFIAVAEEIVSKSPQNSSGEKLIDWMPAYADPARLKKALSGLSSATILVKDILLLTAAERSTLIKSSHTQKTPADQNSADFSDLPPLRYIFCLVDELDQLYEKKLIDDEFYLFLGNLELRLPRVGASNQPKEEAKVLILDDDDLHAQMMEDLLSEAGYHTVKMMNPAEALLTLRKERFSLIITDFRMPGINGADFIVQARQFDANVPIFIVSGNVELPELVRLGNMGVTRILPKPIDTPKFLAEVANFVRH